MEIIPEYNANGKVGDFLTLSVCKIKTEEDAKRVSDLLKELNFSIRQEFREGGEWVIDTHITDVQDLTTSGIETLRQRFRKIDPNLIVQWESFNRAGRG